MRWKVLGPQGRRALRWARLVPLLVGLACTGLASNPLHLFKPRPDSEWKRLRLDRVRREVQPRGLETWERLDWEDLLERVPLGLGSPPCFWIENWVKETAAPILFLVHGIDGLGPEWNRVLPSLMALRPAAVFFYEWSPYEKRDVLAEGLGVGISRVAQCLGGRGGPIMVLGHSAGGVLASLAAGRIVTPRPLEREPRVTVVTVSAPLAGFGSKRADQAGGPELSFLIDLGTPIHAYPPAAPGVRVVHLRTQYPADRVMRPGLAGHRPNQEGVGVPGALEVTLPDTWGHVSALHRITRAMAELRWLPWRNFDEAPAVFGVPAAEAVPPVEVPPRVCVLREEVLRRGEPFVFLDPYEPVPEDRVSWWEGETLPATMPSPDTYVRCRPCDCVEGAVQPWAEWEDVNRRAYERLRRSRAPYPVVIVPGFPDGWVMRTRLRDALTLLRNGWAAALMVSGGHQPGGASWSRWMLDEAVRIAQEELDFDAVDRVFIEPCGTESLAHLRNGLRMMAALEIPYGLLLLDSKMSMQSLVFYDQLERRVPAELQCPVGRVSYLYGDGPRPRVGERATGCHPFLAWRNNPIGYFLTARRPAIFWVSPTSYGSGPAGEAVYSAKDCFGGAPSVVELEPDNQDPWASECVPPQDAPPEGCVPLRR